MNGSLNIALIGAGNLAWHLAPTLDNLGHRVALVYNRNHKARAALIDRLYNAHPQKSLDFSNRDVNLVIIAVSDAAIQEITSEMVLPEHCLLVHTSGSTSIETLWRAAPEHAGVLYPLHSFSKKSKVDFREIPIYIEASDSIAEKILVKLGQSLTKNIYKINGQDRRHLHLAAVFATNFTNHMLSIANEIAGNKNLPFHHMEQMVHENIRKAFAIGPKNSQTGPAIRHDENTLEKHVELLSGNPDLQEIYLLLSKHIMDSMEKKKSR